MERFSTINAKKGYYDIPDEIIIENDKDDSIKFIYKFTDKLVDQNAVLMILI
ncbi:MAG: hypothetical protein HGN29_15065 [Asgard group archaeon]|nr:hypothetical protein [Asgard group archaeon]